MQQTLNAISGKHEGLRLKISAKKTQTMEKTANPVWQRVQGVKLA